MLSAFLPLVPLEPYSYLCLPCQEPRFTLAPPHLVFFVKRRKFSLCFFPPHQIVATVEGFPLYSAFSLISRLNFFPWMVVHSFLVPLDPPFFVNIRYPVSSFSVRFFFNTVFFLRLWNAFFPFSPYFIRRASTLFLLVFFRL